MSTARLNRFRAVPGMAAAIAEIEQRIRQKYPDAEFAESVGEDPRGLHVAATVWSDDVDAVMDLYIDRLVDLQVEDGLPLYVIPVHRAEGARANGAAGSPQSVGD